MRIIYNPGLANENMLNNMISLINPKKSDIVLDVGTGEGNTAFALAKDHRVQMVIAIDQDEGLLEKFRKNRQERLDKGEQFCAIEIKKLGYEDLETEFRDVRFDIITCRAALHHFQNPINFLNSAYKLLNDDGKLNIMDPFFSERTKNIWMSMAKIKESDLKRFYTFEEYIEMLEDAKFQIITCLIFRFPRKFADWIKSLPTSDFNIPNRFKKVIKEMEPTVKKEMLIQEDASGNLLWSYNCFELLAIKRTRFNQFINLQEIKFNKCSIPHP